MKRVFDTVLIVLLFPLLVPVLAVTAVLVRIFLGAPIIFSQQRPGQKGLPFTMYKFRSMTDATDDEGKLLPDRDRLTAFGRFLRSSSLDELPELWNVLRGEMSLVGPRPLLVDYLPLYSERQRRRHEVLPGITGWAQVNGRNGISWEEKFELDVWYVDNGSLLLDCRILIKTLQHLVKPRGVSASGDATMPRFKGSSAVPEGDI